MEELSHRFGLAASSLNLSESSYSVGRDPRLRCPRTVRARYASPQSPPAKLDSDKFGDSRRTKPAGLIESCTQLDRWVSAPNPVHEEGGGCPQRGSGRAPTAGGPTLATPLLESRVLFTLEKEQHPAPQCRVLWQSNPKSSTQFV